jgi:hypothetical protein
MERTDQSTNKTGGVNRLFGECIADQLASVAYYADPMRVCPEQIAEGIRVICLAEGRRNALDGLPGLLSSIAAELIEQGGGEVAGDAAPSSVASPDAPPPAGSDEAVIAKVAGHDPELARMLEEFTKTVRQDEELLERAERLMKGGAL